MLCFAILPLQPLISTFTKTGGTVSLFTGMSILSLCEVGFWASKLLSRFGKSWTKRLQRDNRQPAGKVFPISVLF